MKKFYKIENGILVSGSGTKAPIGFREDWSLLETKEDGGYYTYYNADGTANLIEEEAENRRILDAELKQVKEESLAKLTVTTESGKVFYADTEARVDLESAIRVGELTSQTSTVWKLAEEFEGSKYAQVTIDELREASMLALLAKGSIVGAVQTQGVE